MRKQILQFTWILLVPSIALWGGQALRSPLRTPTARVMGHVTIDEVVGSSAQTTPLPKLKLYLVRAEDSRPLETLQEGCRRATANPNADPLKAYQTCDQNLRKAVDLVPALPAVATAETDRNGQYEFPAVPASGRYNIVAVKTVDGAEPLVIVGLTNRLRAGERVTLDLSANDPWTRARTP